MRLPLPFLHIPRNAVVLSAAAVQTTNPILFVAQPPIPDDFARIASVFGNQLPSVASAGRGGDLMLRYPEASLRNLTRKAGTRYPATGVATAA
jgi:hypothetical protein